MAEPGEDALILGEGDVALSDAQPATGTDAVVYSPETGRGPSQVETGDQVLLITEELAQGPAGVITLGELFGDKALYKGETANILVEASNGGSQPRDFTVDFFEDDVEIESITQQIAPDATVTYRTERTKTDTGCFIYNANTSADYRVCWLNISPGDLLADPDTVWLGGSDLSSDLSLKVTVPDSESSDISVTVDIKEEGTVIDSETANISPGNQYRFTTSVSKSTEQVVEYTADITDGKSGITVETNPVEVQWTDQIQAVIDLINFDVFPRINSLGDQATLEVDAQNTYSQDVNDYTLEFYEDGLKFDESTKYVPLLNTVGYSSTRSKSSPGQFDYNIQDSVPVNVTGDITVSWMYVSASRLEANPGVTQPGDPITLSVDVTNGSSQSRNITMELFEDGSRIFDDSAVISAGDTVTFSTDVTYPTEQKHDYRAFIQDGSGVRAPTNFVTGQWAASGIYADWGSGLTEVNPLSVGSFSGWYNYFDSEAHHGNEISGRCSITLLDDGSSIAPAITYDDGTGSVNNNISATTTFSEDVSVILGDDPPGREDGSYNSDNWKNLWNRENTDGGVAGIGGSGFDITIGVAWPGYFHNASTTFTGSIRFVDNR